jgi:hypothetical protein
VDELEKEVLHCEDCKLWNDGQGWEEGKTFEVWTLRNGMSLVFEGQTVPFWSDYVPCGPHRAKLQEKEVVR